MRDESVLDNKQTNTKHDFILFAAKLTTYNNPRSGVCSDHNYPMKIVIVPLITCFVLRRKAQLDTF